MPIPVSSSGESKADSADVGLVDDVGIGIWLRGRAAVDTPDFSVDHRLYTLAEDGKERRECYCERVKK